MTQREPPPRQQADPEPAASPPAPTPPPVHWTDRMRGRLAEGSLPRRWYDNASLPLDAPRRFTEPHAELVERLTPRTADGNIDEERTKEVLAEAQETYASADARIEGAERRATTLQSAVAIATSLLLAGGALLADASKVRGDGWRAALALFLVLTVASLALAGLRALGATSRIHIVHRPTPTNIIERTAAPAAEARLDLAAETLKDYGYNTKVADWKVAYLGAAAWWFRWALAFLLALAVTLGAYAVFGAKEPESPGKRAASPQQVPTPRRP
jgi:hypothetical protein